MSAYVLDRYTCKNYLLQGYTGPEIAHKTKVVYRLKDKDGSEQLSIGEYLAHSVQTDRSVMFDKILEGEDMTYFEQEEKWVKSLYPDFKKSFKKAFPGSIPVTARFQIYTDQVYFYFYAHERYDFAAYAKDLRMKLGKGIFLYQVSARDMIRLSPAFDAFIGHNGISLCAKSTRDLPEATMDDIIIQNLEGRDIDRCKTWSGKFDPSFAYETDLYFTESKKYPEKGSIVVDKSGQIKGKVISFNILTGDVKVKPEDDHIYVLPCSQLQGF